MNYLRLQFNNFVAASVAEGLLDGDEKREMKNAQEEGPEALFFLALVNGIEMVFTLLVSLIIGDMSMTSYFAHFVSFCGVGFTSTLITMGWLTGA